MNGMISTQDQEAIALQIGRLPHGLIAVAARCPAGHPAVVTTYPLRRRGATLAPFPTFYWLTCPALRRAVSQLERRGVIGLIESRLRDDPALARAIELDHERYIALRWEALSPQDREEIARRGLLEAFRARGIGGLLNRGAIKCLHLHLAHHLAQGSAVGAILSAQYGLCPCPAGAPGAATHLAAGAG